jgi:effector-binding domain-containing protein
MNSRFERSTWSARFVSGGSCTTVCRTVGRAVNLIYDRRMLVSVFVQTVQPRTLAAVRREVEPGAVGAAWGSALGKVWQFIRSEPGLWTNGHNIFVYRHPQKPDAPILCDFGVEVTRTFETAGEVYATETPGGEAAVAIHSGPYDRVNDAHTAIRKWMAANRRQSAGLSWEIYGDPTPDPADTKTTVVYLLK